MALDDVTNDGQPQTGSAAVACSAFVESGESLEDRLSVLDRDPAAVVVDGQPNVAVDLGQVNADFR